MKKFFTSIILFTLTFYLANGQDWIWSRHAESAGNTRVWSMTLDNSDNVYTSGNFTDVIDIGAPSPLTDSGAANTYLAKYDSDGNYLWHKHLAGSVASGTTVKRGMIATDQSGNVIITAFYNGQVTNDALIPQSQNSTEDGLLIKYPANGSSPIFQKRIAWGPANVNPQHVTTDPSGNIYVTGLSTDVVHFTATDSIYHVTGQVINFIAKFDASGNFIWATPVTYSSTNTNRNKFVEISAASSSEIYAAGFFNESVDAGSFSLSTTSFENGLLLKLDGSGNVVWARMGGSTDAHDRFNGVSTGPNGNIFITGYIQNTAIFDSTAAMSQNSSPIISAGGFDMFVAKYNRNGTLRWKRKNGDTGPDIGYGAFISENIVMFSGYYSGTVTFNNTTLNSGSTSNNNTGFFVYDTDGNPITARDIPGDDDDRGESVEYDSDGNTYIAGFFSSSDLTVGDSVFTANGQDGFVAKYHNPFSATFSNIRNVSCNGGSDGELQVTPYFGIGPYSYEWSPNVTDFVNDSAYNLAADFYSVTVTDNRDSTTVISTSVTEADALEVTFDKTDLSCYQSQDGEIDITVTGGTVAGDYDYNWSGGTGLKPVEGDQDTLSAGWYYLTVTDDNLCVVTGSVELLQPDKILFGTSVVTNASSGGSDGSIDVNLTGGTPGFAYAWAKNGIPMPGRVNDTLLNLQGATYEVTVTDANTCEADTNFVVTDISLLQINKYITPVSCSAYSDGGAAVQVVNKDPVASYTYNWSTGGSDTNIVNVPAAKYYITINEIGGLGRTLNDSLTVTEPDPLEIVSMVPTSVDCYGESKGAITVTVDGGTPDYTYDWSSGQTSESITLVPAGMYSLTVTDANLCTTEDAAEITQNDSIEIVISVINEITCFGFDDGALQAVVTGGAGGYSYQWDDEGEQTSSLAVNLTAGVYRIDITDNLECTNFNTFNLVEPDPIEFSVIDTQDVSCYSSSDGSISVTVIGGTPPYSYSWNPSFPDTNQISDLPAFTYNLTVTDNTGLCQNPYFTYTVKRPTTELAVAELIASHVDNICFEGNDGEFELEADGGWGGYEYSIDVVEWLPTVLFENLIANNYVARVRDAGGCIANTIIEIEEPDELIISSQFVIGNSILISATGGTPPYTFTLDGETSNSTGQFNDVPDGEHIVEVTDAEGCGPVETNPLIVGTAIHDLSQVQLNIYPNPSNGTFNISFESMIESEFLVEIFSMTGARVYNEEVYIREGSNQVLIIDLGDVGTGIYMIKLNGVALDYKLIIQ